MQATQGDTLRCSKFPQSQGVATHLHLEKKSKKRENESENTKVPRAHASRDGLAQGTGFCLAVEKGEDGAPGVVLLLVKPYQLHVARRALIEAAENCRGESHEDVCRRSQSANKPGLIENK